MLTRPPRPALRRHRLPAVWPRPARPAGAVGPFGPGEMYLLPPNGTSVTPCGILPCLLTAASRPAAGLATSRRPRPGFGPAATRTPARAVPQPASRPRAADDDRRSPVSAGHRQAIRRRSPTYRTALRAFSLTSRITQRDGNTAHDSPGSRTLLYPDGPGPPRVGSTATFTGVRPPAGTPVSRALAHARSGQQRHARWRTRADPPFGTHWPMTMRLVADIQNRLFWRAGTLAAASGCCFPVRDGTGHPKVDNDCHGAG